MCRNSVARILYRHFLDSRFCAQKTHEVCDIFMLLRIRVKRSISLAGDMIVTIGMRMNRFAAMYSTGRGHVRVTTGFPRVWVWAGSGDVRGEQRQVLVSQIDSIVQSNTAAIKNLDKWLSAKRFHGIVLSKSIYSCQGCIFR